MLYRERTEQLTWNRALARLASLFDGRRRRQRRTEMDLISLSPYLRRDIGFPPPNEKPQLYQIGGQIAGNHGESDN